MTSLFNLEDYTTPTKIHDPYWDEIVLDCSGKVESNGQVTFFYDDSEEPPDPDDFPTLDHYEFAFSSWRAKYPDIPLNAMADDGPFLDVVDSEFIDDLDNLPEQTNTVLETSIENLPEQNNNVLETSVDNLPEQNNNVLEDSPESSRTLSQWTETYAVRRGTKKHWYYRYCYYHLGKIHHIHIPGGNSTNAIAIERKSLIEEAIALGKTPQEITHFIAGGFGLSGYNLVA